MPTDLYAKRNNESLRLDLGAALTDLGRYSDALRANFETLAQGIDQRYARSAVDDDKQGKDGLSPRSGAGGI